MLRSSCTQCSEQLRSPKQAEARCEGQPFGRVLDLIETVFFTFVTPSGEGLRGERCRVPTDSFQASALGGL